MYKKLLVAMSLEHGIGKTALEIAQKMLDPGGEIIALHVREAHQSSVKAFIEDDVAKKIHADALAQLEKRVSHIEGSKPVVLSGHGARTIIDYAADKSVDCIVLGSHKPGLQDYFLGSTSSRVVRHAYCAAHVLRD